MEKGSISWVQNQSPYRSLFHVFPDDRDADGRHSLFLDRPLDQTRGPIADSSARSAQDAVCAGPVSRRVPSGCRISA